MEKTHKILVLPDIHGRDFWRKPCNEADNYDHIIFLGDYLDPYSFEGITVEQAISNFKDILDFVKNHQDKVTMLLGNHDIPYYDVDYRRLSRYHCRIAPYELWDDIMPLYKRYPFKVACRYDDILFTHAGVQSEWLEFAFPKYEFNGDIDDLVEKLNGLLCKEGYKKLYITSYSRGGDYPYASCIWTDVSEMMYDYNLDAHHPPIREVKQVFGHTLQATYDPNDRNNILYGRPLEFFTMKMLDTTNAYILDTETYKIDKVEKTAEE